MKLNAGLISLLHRKALSESQAREIFTALFKGNLTESQAKAILLLLASKGESSKEFTGCLNALRTLEPPASVGINYLMDTCGTGGDMSGSFNVSTLAAFVIAGAGGKIAKHGNRSISSRCGSSDLMEALGVRLNAPRSQMIKAIKNFGLGYFHAPFYHPVFSKIQLLRRKLKTRTIFNLLGPLTNPLKVSHQLVGVSDKKYLKLFAQAFQKSGITALICHSQDGMDEISTRARTDIALVHKGGIRYSRIDPKKYSFKVTGKNTFVGGSIKKNKVLALQLLRGKLRGPIRDLVVLNAAAGLWITKKAANLKEGIRLAEKSIDSGKAYQVLARLRKISHSG